MTASEQEERQRTAIRAWRAVEAATKPGDAGYDRHRHLPRLVPVGPEELADATRQGRRRILYRLARALRAERVRGRSGHWTYDLNRHLGLIEAYRAERAAFAAGPRSEARKGSTPDGTPGAGR